LTINAIELIRDHNTQEKYETQSHSSLALIYPYHELRLYIVRLLILLVYSIVLFGCKPRSSEIQSIYCTNDFYDGSYINNNIARGQTFFGEGSLQFMSYYDNQGRVVIVRRHLDTGQVDKSILDAGISVSQNPPASLSNPHNFISGGLDTRGYIHLIFGAHNSRAQHYVSGTPFNPYGWREIGEWMDRISHNVTYPYLVKAPNKDLWLFYRDGRSGYGSTFIVRGLSNSSSSSINPQILIDGHKKEINKTTLRHQHEFPGVRIDPYYENSQYLFSPVVSPDGCIHLAWTWRLSDFSIDQDNPWQKKGFQGVTNRDIVYARSCDNGDTWTDSSGRVYHLPLTRLGEREDSHPEIIDTIDVGSSFYNHYGSAIDSANHVHYIYHNLDDINQTQIWHLFNNGRSWIKNKVSAYKKNIPWNRLQVSGLVGTALSRPEILIDLRDNSAIVFTRSDIYGNRLEIYRSTPPYKNWTREIVETGSLGGWEPQIDKRLFLEQGQIELLMNTVRDNNSYQLFDVRLTISQQNILDSFYKGHAQDYPDYTILSPVLQFYLDKDDVRYRENQGCISRLILRKK